MNNKIYFCMGIADVQIITTDKKGLLGLGWDYAVLLEGNGDWNVTHSLPLEDFVKALREVVLELGEEEP